MDAPIEYTGTDDIASLVIGTQGILCERRTLKLDVIRTNVSDWSDEDCIAIKLINPDGCYIDIPYAYGHTLGLQMIGSGAGCVSNIVRLARMRNNKIHIDLTNEYYNGKKGWCNENILIGGYLTHVGGFNSTLSRYAIRITSKETDPAKIEENNNNVFYKPCIELGTVALPAESVPILIEHGSFNSIYDVRNEGNGTPFVRTSGTSTENYITTGFGTATVEDNSSAPVTILGPVRSRWHGEYNKLVYDSGAVHKKACYYDNSAEKRVSVAGIGGITSTTYGSLNAYTRYADIYSDYIEARSGYGFGVYVKTDQVHTLIIDSDAEVGYGGRVLVKCFDVDGTVLTSAGANHPYVKGTSQLLFTYNAGYGGVYGTGADHNGAAYVYLHEDVDHVIVYVTSGTANLHLRSLKIYSTLVSATTWNWDSRNDVNCVATMEPVFGTYEIGKRIRNAVPTVGQPKAWISTVAGTMGTLNAGATTGDITSGTATLTVSDATGLAVGNYITIAGVTGVKKITVISGTTVTIDTNADATVNDAAVAYSNATWVSEGNL
jgi:hypothetical protein